MPPCMQCDAVSCVASLKCQPCWPMASIDFSNVHVPSKINIYLQQKFNIESETNEYQRRVREKKSKANRRQPDGFAKIKSDSPVPTLSATILSGRNFFAYKTPMLK